MNGARDAIIDKRFMAFKEEFIGNYTQGKDSEWIIPQKIED